MLGGEVDDLGRKPIERKIDYELNDDRGWIRVDCLTDEYAIEVGLDNKRGSFDSLHQAIFAAIHSDRDPLIAIIDTNGIEENEEYQIESVAKYASVQYKVFSKHYLDRWYATQRYVNNRPYYQGREVDLSYVHEIEQRGNCRKAPAKNLSDLGLDKDPLFEDLPVLTRGTD